MNGDPIGSDAPRGKSCEKRMGRYDGGFTPSEQRLKNQLMRQFTRLGEGPGGNSAEYRANYDAIDWSDGRNAAWAEHDARVKAELALLDYPTPWSLSLMPDDSKSAYASNYDLIDWSK
jgi:hypothetical protein